ncbi:alpha/beta hydrolase family esterase [Pseudomonas tolaasii]|uniref:alpha/beta hydrolase family esterase n=1 Tax=Pseudomonas tolaasii TaxID=29442 RepID=UPI0004CF6B8A|nr:alpha/beta hydrolase-fold protein [Pseudomonas tolaasii]
MKTLCSIVISRFLIMGMLFFSLPSISAEQAKYGQQRIRFTEEAGGERSFYVALPKNYSSAEKYKLLMVFPGTDTTGSEMRDFIGTSWMDTEGLEGVMPDTIIVYPDPKSRYFAGWDSTHLGWLLGPFGLDAKGTEDLAFVNQLLNWLNQNYSITPNQVFATGHSWGGDMAAVVGCFLGDRFRAVAPVAANRPYWFETSGKPLSCKGNAAVWTFFGLDDEHFATDQVKSGDFGVQQDNFWKTKANCSEKNEGLLREHWINHLNISVAHSPFDLPFTASVVKELR